MDGKLINDETKSREITKYLQAAVLSIHVSYQAAGTVPCWIYLILRLTRSTKQCDVAAFKVNSSGKEYESNCSLQRTTTIFEGFLISNIFLP